LSARSAIRALLAALLLTTGTALVAPGASGATGATRACNGAARLCARSLGDVAFATTHNSMASSADGFLPPNQRRSMRKQLAHGIRGLQIDAYLATARASGVWTDRSGALGDTSELPPALVRVAQRLHHRLGAPPAGTPDDVYLCHVFCELGAVRMVDELRVVREFLDHHPDDVLVMVVEDHAPVDRIEAAFRDAGLGRELLPVDPAQPLPTLGAMVDAGTRLQVSLENGDDPPTLPNAFVGLVEETPFTFRRPRALTRVASCAVHRGGADAPVFQLNHWVTPAEPVTAHRVNSRILRERVADCVPVRGRGPTLLAVDFAERGDLLAVVDQLNR
jgi:hypothetical protein